MAKLKNEDFRINPAASGTNAIKIRADVCKCGDTICDYTLQIPAAVTTIELDDDYIGHELLLLQAAYNVNAPEAALLETELKQLFDGVAENVSALYNSGTGTIDIAVKGSQVSIKSANAVYPFTKSACRGTGNQ